MPELIALLILLVSAGTLFLSGGAILVTLAYGWTVLRYRDRAPTYGGFVKGCVTKHRRMVFLWSPLALMAGLVSAVLVLGPYRTATLRRDLATATEMKVRSGGHCHRFPERERVFLETTDSAVINDFLSQVSLRPGAPCVRCMCCGDLSFEFFKDGKLIKSFSLHHGQSIRIQHDRFNDYWLSSKSQASLHRWLTRKGIQQQLEAFQQSLREKGDHAETQAAN